MGNLWGGYVAIAITEADPGLRGLSEVKFFMPLASTHQYQQH